MQQILQMTSPFEYFGMALAPLTILYNFAKKYNKKRVTKDRLFSAIEIEYSEFKKKLNEIEKKNKIIIDYLDIIEKESNDYIASELVVYSSLQFKL